MNVLGLCGNFSGPLQLSWVSSDIELKLNKESCLSQADCTQHRLKKMDQLSNCFSAQILLKMCCWCVFNQDTVVGHNRTILPFTVFIFADIMLHWLPWLSEEWTMCSQTNVCRGNVASRNRARGSRRLITALIWSDWGQIAGLNSPPQSSSGLHGYMQRNSNEAIVQTKPRNAYC